MFGVPILPACSGALVEVSGCQGDCDCLGGGESSGTCRAVTACGGEGQRACCLSERGGLIGGAIIPPCQHHLVEEPGCDGNCLCGLGTGESSSGTCRVPPCGGAGQRACCSGEVSDLRTCQAGLTAVLGCTGDCTCGNNASLTAHHSCTAGDAANMTEPETGFTPEPDPGQCALRGYADLHVHLFAHLAHGGNIFGGKPFDREGGVVAALSEGAIHGLLHGPFGDVLGMGTGDVDVTLPPFLLPPHTLSHYGAPLFNGWPTWHSTTHQQVYYKWLERAWQGGLRLMSALAVTNEALCKSKLNIVEDYTEWLACEDSMASIDAQLEAAWDLQDFIDEQHGGAGQGWFRIVQSSEEARNVIAAGKLAVVLGIEVEHLFNCRATCSAKREGETDEQHATRCRTRICGPQGDNETDEQYATRCEPLGCGPKLAGETDQDVATRCSANACRGKLAGETDEAYVTRKVEEYYQLGVRQIFPIHNFDNGFGSPATWQDSINLGNRVTTGHWWDAEACDEFDGDGAMSPDPYTFKLASGDFTQILGVLAFNFAYADLPNYPSGADSCNKDGLTDLGEHLITELMDRGVVIDVDHMSNRALDATLDILESEPRGYPVVASHVQFEELNRIDVEDPLNSLHVHERMRTRRQLERIRDLGGMVAAMTKDDLADTDSRGLKGTIKYGDDVPDDCRHSSLTFAQAYQYAVDVMGGPVAFGSDFNGVAAHVGPRFGHEACGGDLGERGAQVQAQNRLQYPIEIEGFGRFDRQKTGERTFDFNHDGLAHMGLLPDLIADMENVGLPREHVDRLFQSAEAFVQLWERAEGGGGTAPTCSAEDVTVSAGADCKADVELLDPDLIPAVDSGDLSWSQSPAGPYALGSTEVELMVSQVGSSCITESCTATVTVEDTTPPELLCPLDVTAECTDGMANLPALPEPQLGSDNCGIPTLNGCSASAPRDFPLGSTPVSCTARDDAEEPNTATCSYQVNVLDTMAPYISCPLDITTECTGGGRADVDVGAPDADDACDDQLEVENDSPESFSLGETTVEHFATDDSEHSSSCFHFITVVDTTPPEISCPAPATVECTGNNRAPFTPLEPQVFDTCAQDGGPALTVVTPPAASFPLGSTTLTYSVTDVGENSASCETSVRVQDTTAPTIHSVAASPNKLWPPNHKMINIAVNAVSTDICDPSAPVCTLTSIDVNEADNALGDGNTSGDAIITGPLSAQLRAERSGQGSGRVYTLHLRCADETGNASVATTEVRVPKSQGK